MKMKIGDSLAFASKNDFSIIEYDYATKLFRGDYSPPSPPPPSPPPHPPSVLCEDLKGIGSLNTTLSGNASLFGGSVINVTARAGELPNPKTGTPDDAQGGGAGHGGRGASCVMDNKKLPEDVWGGDAYSWESLDKPWSYGSKGGTTNKGEDFGGIGGGRIWLEVKHIADVRGQLLADGGDGGIKGGGGSGGSIYIVSQKM
ncbi:UNVERIFIED_CONTAM: hypothetical protein Sradi_3360200 [Sesamum radiatum]|uniref:Uncharacterized protein n=1 Tax=Sesamum radiatum TaxID=300843 RepID=A0AAW2R2K6_SESRA